MRFDVGARRGLVERDPERPRIDAAEVHPRRDGRARRFARGLPAVATVIVSKNCAVRHAVNRAVSRPAFRIAVKPVHAARDASRARRGRDRRAYIAAITASSTCAVQMFDVAFSRRMCCSRVCSARRYAGSPLRVDGHADEAARHLSA